LLEDENQIMPEASFPAHLPIEEANIGSVLAEGG
jgi:hypothetical protein